MRRDRCGRGSRCNGSDKSGDFDHLPRSQVADSGASRIDGEMPMRHTGALRLSTLLGGTDDSNSPRLDYHAAWYG